MGKASYWTQADALLRKNLTFQKRNKRSNISLIIFPVLLCVLLVLLQVIIDSQLDKPDYKCGCNSENQCGLEYSSPVQAPFCALTSPMKWPGLLQIPAPEYRAVRTDFMRSTDLPDESCRASGTCPVITLLTGNNQSLAQSLGDYMLKSSPLNASDSWASLASNVFGTASIPDTTIYFDRAFSPGNPVYWIQPQCPRDFSLPVEVNVSNNNFEIDVKCAQALNLWRSSSSQINDELYKGYRRGNPEKKINEIVGAYDFINSTGANFNVNIWYNATYKNDTGYHQFNLIGMARVPRSVNLVSNAYLQFLQGPSTKILFEFIKEMPKPGTELHVDISSLVGPMFFAFVIIALFPTVLTFLVYENQNRLRIMMKMHGLGDGPYWLISYAYFLALSSLYMICFVVFASLIGLKFFKLNDYSIQFVFYFLYINLQISLAFLVAPFFSNVLTARVIGYILIFGTGLLGGFLLEPILVDTEFPKGWILVMELYPGFSLYRGLYEFGQYAFMGNLVGSSGMEWKNLSDDQNGMKEVLIIMLIEWLILLPLAFYVDSVVSSGSGVKRSPLYFLSRFWKSSPTLRKPSLRKNGSKVFVELEKPDVLHERERVGQMLNEGNTNDSVICDNLAKVYPGRDGNPPKNAVKGISLALPRGECFGMLGPNGAGKTSFIGMMIGLLKPTSGRAYVEGHDILTQMDEIYTSMGVCPQHDLLWESLTGREHLMFYGRLKNLKGNALLQAVEESLKSVNLFYGGVGNKLSKKYSGGMKRRLSVAISLIGDPKVVYMDEPSTGLDPASRNNLWNVVRRAKRDRAIVLTTHSMEEAEHLCDRLGIFVDGSLQCIGNPKELKARYGGSFVFTMTTESSHENEVRNMVQSLSPNAQRIYHISGTQKFELPKQEVRISDVFQAVQNAKSRFAVYAWGIADTTLEDVFIKVAREAQAFNVFS